MTLLSQVVGKIPQHQNPSLNRPLRLHPKINNNTVERIPTKY